MINPKAIQAFLQTGYNLYIVNKIRFNKLVAELDNYLQPMGLQMDEKLKKRIWLYTLQSAATNSWFTDLRGYKTTKDEQQVAIYLGAYTPVYDDLVDDQTMNHDDIERLQRDQFKDNTHYTLIWYLYDKLKLHLPKNGQFKHYFQLSGQAQTASLQQIKKDRLNCDDIQKITFDKGGYATLLYRSILENEIEAKEEKAIYQLGAALQLVNDVFDVYKDHQQGLQTCITNTADINIPADIFEENVNTCILAFNELPYSKIHIERMLWKIKVMLSRGYVCFEQLKALPAATEEFSPVNYSRSQLICDMERLKNIKRSLQIASDL